MEPRMVWRPRQKNLNKYVLPDKENMIQWCRGITGACHHWMICARPRFDSRLIQTDRRLFCTLLILIFWLVSRVMCYCGVTRGTNDRKKWICDKFPPLLVNVHYFLTEIGMLGTPFPHYSLPPPSIWKRWRERTDILRIVISFVLERQLWLCYIFCRIDSRNRWRNYIGFRVGTAPFFMHLW